MTKAVDAKLRTTRSLVRASLDIGRALADRDGVTFRAKGICMHPTIRAGDVLRIKSCSAVDVPVGEIAVCRRPNYMFAHRVIARGVEGGRAYVVTRPDRAREGSDGPTFDENLLGMVAVIERKGKSVPLQPGAHSWPVHRCFEVRLALRELMSPVRPWLADKLVSLQNGVFCRPLVRKWLDLKRPCISYAVRLPMPGLGDSVYRLLSPEALDVRKDWRGRPVARWTLTLHLNGARRPAAWATFVRGTADEWRVDESFVSARYRGAGLYEALLRRADAILLTSCDAKDQRKTGEENTGFS
jgi:GNAT superfamily N-acetyltransferase